MKKKIIVLAVVACLAVMSVVGATLAYLTATDSAKNTFTFGNVDIAMDDVKTDLYGKPVEGAARVISNNYKLVPNNTYKKDTTIYVTKGSEACYLFVKVETTVEDNENVLTYNFKDGWKSLGNGVYCYETTVDASAATANVSVSVIDSLTVANTATDLSAFNEKTVTVIGYAVQAAGFEEAEDAWNATFGATTNP